MVEVGDKIKVTREVQRYTVQAASERYVVMTKPFNARKTYLYTIVDLEEGVRGPIDLIFGLPHDCNTPKDAAWLLRNMVEQGWGVSRRRQVLLTADERELFGLEDLFDD